MRQAQFLGGQFQVFVKELLLRAFGVELRTLQCFDVARTRGEFTT